MHVTYICHGVSLTVCGCLQNTPVLLDHEIAVGDPLDSNTLFVGKSNELQVILSESGSFIDLGLT